MYFLLLVHYNTSELPYFSVENFFFDLIHTNLEMQYIFNGRHNEGLKKSLRGRGFIHFLLVGFYFHCVTVSFCNCGDEDKYLNLIIKDKYLFYMQGYL